MRCAANNNGRCSTLFVAVCIYINNVALLDSKQLPIAVFAFLFTNEQKMQRNKIHTAGTTGSRTTSIKAGSKGFGKSETLEQLLKKFPTRIPDKTDNQQPCPCGVDGKSYGDCCYPYHTKAKFPESSKRVLQSRYSAFVYRLIGYIMDTTHTSCRDYRNDKISWAKSMNKNGMFDSFEFIALNITLCDTDEINLPAPTSEGYIEFQVTLRAGKAKQQQTNLLSSSNTDETEIRIHERSKFLKDNSTGHWTYASGVVRSSTNGLEELILNP